MSDEKLTDNGRPPVGSGLQNEHERAKDAEIERLRAVIMVQRDPDSCSRCDAVMDGDTAATGDICHDCWQGLESRLAEATALLEEPGRDMPAANVQWHRRYSAFLANQPAAPSRVKVPGEFASWQIGDRVQLKGPLVDAFDAAPARTEAEPRGHHCGLSGWDPMRDEPCPACLRSRLAYEARRGLK